jgi:type 1 glutamine amidotransferase
MLMTLEYGNGRVFHTVLGHADYSMNCVGFATTLQRGTEWAATSKVTIPVPEDFPTAHETRSQK